MKKLLTILLAAVLCVMMAVAVNAADVYVTDGGEGDGTTAETPMGSLEDAIASIADEGGTVHIVNTYSHDGEFSEPEHAAPITVTGGEFIFAGAKNRWYLNGETTFENITITAADPSKGAVIVAQFNPIVMGEGVTVPEKTYLLGGHQLDGMGTDTAALMADKGWPLDKDSYITVKSGVYHVVSGYSRGASTAIYTGTSHLNIEGGTINMLLGGSCNGSAGHNAEINIYGGEITTLMTAGDSTRRLNGDCTVNIYGGSIATLDICNIMGVGTVNISGGNVGQAAKRVTADAQYMVDGTVTLNILEGATVLPGVSMGFDVVNGEVSSPVINIPGITDETEEVAETTAPAAETTEAPAVTEEGGVNPVVIVVVVVAIIAVVAVVVVVAKKKK
ncbi:MAG: hypothetical protein IJ002_00720 [Clostridia bacterium]|nr:hypothetical protein [Clostridia bacterium]